MTANTTEEFLLLIESTANFMRGLTLDPAIPAHAKEAMRYQIAVLEAAVEKYAD